MNVSTSCPKCPGLLQRSTTSHGASFSWCTFCKGLWILFSDFPKIFKNNPLVSPENKQLLRQSLPTKFKCSTCQSPLKVGKFLDSDLELDHCENCQGYFFDVTEMNKFLDLLQGEIPHAPSTTINHENMMELETTDCPVCKTAHLWTVQGKEINFKYCLTCEGLSTSVETIQKMLHRSMFSPTMFTFRVEQGVIARCRFCQEEQSYGHSQCQKCGRDFFRIKCVDCKSAMSEYILKDLVIERCQMCNSLWLDSHELEQIFTTMSDVRKQYEEARNKSELLRAENKIVVRVAEMGQTISNRKMVDRFWGVWGCLFFYD